MNRFATPPKSDGAAHSGWERRTHTLSLLLMAWATLGFAWSSFQSSLWVGMQTFKLIDSTSYGRRSDLQAAVANQMRLVDLSLFIEYERFSSEGNGRLTQFLLNRMRPELREAMEAWTATRPLQNRDAPATPFELPEYKVPAEVESEKLLARSAELYNQAQRANTTCDRYQLLTVLFTASLFLSGLVGGLGDRRSRQIMLGLGLVVLVAATSMLVRLPVASLQSEMAAGYPMPSQENSIAGRTASATWSSSTVFTANALLTASGRRFE
jgi:hypothetical protein